MLGDCLLDSSNILLRMTKTDDAHYAVIIETLDARGARLCFTSQTLGEFWNACTRPRENNGFGLSTAETESAGRVIERDFIFLPIAMKCISAGGNYSSPMT